MSILICYIKSEIFHYFKLVYNSFFINISNKDI